MQRINPRPKARCTKYIIHQQPPPSISGKRAYPQQGALCQTSSCRILRTKQGEAQALETASLNLGEKASLEERSKYAEWVFSSSWRQTQPFLCRAKTLESKACSVRAETNRLQGHPVI